MTKIAWIIGASTGIGKATARCLQDDGYGVVLSSRRKDSLVKAAKDMSSQTSVMTVPCDVTDLESLHTAKTQILNSHGKIDLVVFMAGIYDPMSLKDYDHKKALMTLDVNLKGAFHVFEAMRQEALDPLTPLHLAWTASVAGYRGLPNSGAYGASKAALINFVEIQKAELKNFNTKVQIINPGFVKTRLTDKNDFEMPMQISTTEAAESIKKGLRKSKFEILFPSAFGIIMKIIRMLPYWLYFKLAQKLNKADD